ncbi:MAG: hypothetical protein AAGN35_02040 [Bacteroidota bacterium]
MNWRTWTLGLLLAVIAYPATAQLTLQVSSRKRDVPRYSPPGTIIAPNLEALAGQRDFQLPRHVRNNPRGYSPLCRLELRLENELPVAMWVKLGPNPDLTYAIRSNAEVRLKLLKF